MARTLTYDFCELPLLTRDGFDAGLINGSVLVDYWSGGEWGISQVYLDGYSALGQRSVLLDRGEWLHSAILSRFEEPLWFGRVQEAVNDAIDEERAA